MQFILVNKSVNVKLKILGKYTPQALAGKSGSIVKELRRAN